MDINNLANTTLDLFQQNKTAVVTTASAAALVLSVPLLSRIASDYRAWYALGPNGIPLNIFGYLFQAAASPFARLDTRVPAPYDAAALSKRYGALTLQSFLPRSPLPPRSGPRPDVPAYVGPQRQTSQQASAETRDAQESFLHAFAAANPDAVRVRPSNLEGPLFNSLWLRDGVPVRGEIRRLGGEFAHPHGEGSTHLVLSLADAARAIEGGWAERHRMSGVGSLMPWGFVLIYAPRDDDELEVWKGFVLASARYVLGGEKEAVMP
ncbi:hypothetical protein F4820DRAFT_124556 [Hypoxylon rubiginosum]|uniref:Uncharacterized protein n=1 Tax=Hypoxylon rubiginosum TaxID=110542 RepID=A0ACB9ZA58_9PEZI|nr:hypothetical protein F4820DRAFT_124556 [Hypoxylon rubiginosum]